MDRHGADRKQPAPGAVGRPTRRAVLLGAAAGATALAAGPRPTIARTAQIAAGSSGFLSRNVGDLEIVALLDGQVSLPVGEVAKFLEGATPEQTSALSEKARVPATGMPLLVAAFLVRDKDRLTLIDAGAADKFQPPHFGKVPAAIKAAGFALADIDSVLVTHAHGDHIGGLVDPGGAAYYPNAEVVIGETEHAFWMDDSNAARVAELQKPFFALTKQMLAPYAKRMRRFTGTAEVIPGIAPVPLPGHTPGHTGFLVASGNEQVLVWGDALHVAAWQFDRPDWRMAFDIDPTAGIVSRRHALDMAATDRLMVAGMHLPFPSFARVAREGDAYRYVPAL